MRTLSLLFVGAVVAACSKSEPAPSCATVVDHTLEVTKIKYPGHDGMELGDRKGMIEQCEKTMSAEQRRCLATAKDLDAIGVCRGVKKPDSKSR